MMKVYLLYVTIPYEGGWFCGIYSTREKAQKRIDDALEYEDSDTIEEGRNDIPFPNDAYVVEVEIDKDTDIAV